MGEKLVDLMYKLSTVFYGRGGGRGWCKLLVQNFCLVLGFRGEILYLKTE